MNKHNVLYEIISDKQYHVWPYTPSGVTIQDDDGDNNMRMKE